MRVLVACEVSGRVRSEFRARGHDAWSCDLEEADDGSPHHYCGDVRDVLDDGWDMVVGFPPCTYLSVVAVSCLHGTCAHSHPEGYIEWRWRQFEEAVDLFQALLNCGAGRVAVENPVHHPAAQDRLGPPTAISEPFWFGDQWRKRTHWWLRGLAPLQPTRIVVPEFRWVNSGKGRRWYRGLPAVEHPTDRPRAYYRSLTPPGTAAAIADQWGSPVRQTLF